MFSVGLVGFGTLYLGCHGSLRLLDRAEMSAYDLVEFGPLSPQIFPILNTGLVLEFPLCLYGLDFGRRIGLRHRDRVLRVDLFRTQIIVIPHTVIYDLSADTVHDAEGTKTGRYFLYGAEGVQRRPATGILEDFRPLLNRVLTHLT